MGQNKMLIEVNGMTLLEHTIKVIKFADFCLSLLVHRTDFDPRDYLLLDETVLIQNSQSEEGGLASSLAYGLRSLPRKIQYVSVCLSDQPLLTKEDYNRIIRAVQEAPPNKSIFVPIYRGQRGNPVTFSTRYIPEILATVKGDQGAKFLLKKYPGEVEFIEMPNDAILFDVDTPEDLAELRRRVEEQKKT